MIDSAQQPAPLGPVAPGERIASLDVLRGFALLGILMVNMQFFAMPFGEFVDPSLGPGTPLYEKLAWASVKTLFEYKFISLFSLLFGAGLVIQMNRARARGAAFVPLYLRRLAVLAVFGLVHALLWWYGDILFLYAYVGAGVVWLRRLSAKVLLITAGAVAAGLVGLQALIVVGVLVYVSLVQGPAPAGAGAEPESSPAAWSSSWDPTSESFRAEETAAYRNGPFLEVLRLRATCFAFLAIGAPFAYGWHVVFMFLAGMALMKLGFFSPGRRVWQRRLAVIGLAAGLPLELAFTGLSWAGFAHDRLELMVIGTLVHEFGGTALCLGLTGAVTWLVSAGRAAAVTRPVAAAGRLALTNYLGQTLIATAIMYWWGLGLFGEVSRVELVAITAAIYLFEVAASVAYLRVARIGPLEWLWRALTYLRPPPILRRPEDPTA